MSFLAASGRCRFCLSAVGFARVGGQLLEEKFLSEVAHRGAADANGGVFERSIGRPCDPGRDSRDLQARPMRDAVSPSQQTRPTLGYAKRYGAAYANGLTESVITPVLLPSLFKQDP